MPYLNTMFLSYVRQSDKAGYFGLDLPRRADWCRRLREAEPRSPWTVAEVTHAYESGMTASNSLTKIALNLATYLCSLANSEFVTLDDKGPLGPQVKAAEQTLQGFLKTGKLTGGAYVTGLEKFAAVCTWDALKRLLSVPLPEECARFVIASKELTGLTTDVQPHAWQKFIERKLGGQTLGACKLVDFFKAVLNVRNAEAHGGSGGVVAGPNAVTVNLNQGNDEEWHSVFCHYLAPAMIALLLNEDFARCVEELQVVDLVQKRGRVFSVVWPQGRGGPEYPSDLVAAEDLSGRVVARLDGDKLTFLASFREFPQPRQRIDEQRLRLSHRVAAHLLANGVAPSVDEIKLWRSEGGVDESISPDDVRGEGMALAVKLSRWSESQDPLDESLSFAASLTPKALEFGAADQTKAVRALVAESFGKMDDLVGAAVTKSMSTVSTVAEILGDKTLAKASVDRLARSGKLFALDSAAPDHGVIRVSLLSECETLARVVDECKGRFPGELDGPNLADLLAILHSLLQLVGAEVELKQHDLKQYDSVTESTRALTARVIDGLDQWAEWLRRGGVEPTDAHGTLTTVAPAGAGQATAPLLLEIDDERIVARGLVGLFRGLQTVSAATMNPVLRARLGALARRVGENAVKIGYKRRLFNDTPSHQGGSKFGYPVEVMLDGHKLYFEASGIEKEQGLVALARALADVGCHVAASADGTSVFPDVTTQVDGGSTTDEELAITILPNDSSPIAVKGKTVREFLRNLVRAIETAKCLPALEAATPVLVGRRAGTRRYIIARAPKHLDDKAFVAMERVSTEAGDFYLELNWSHDGAMACASMLCEKAGLSTEIDGSEEEEDALVTGDPSDGGGAVAPSTTEFGFTFGDRTVQASSVSDLFRRLFDALDQEGLLAGLLVELGDGCPLGRIVDAGSGRVATRSLWSTTATHANGREYKDAREYRGPNSSKEFWFEANFTRPVAQTLATALVRRATDMLKRGNLADNSARQVAPPAPG